MSFCGKDTRALTSENGSWNYFVTRFAQHAIVLAEKAQLLAPGAAVPTVIKVEAMLISEEYAAAVAICEATMIEPAQVHQL